MPCIPIAAGGGGALILLNFQPPCEPFRPNFRPGPRCRCLDDARVDDKTCAGRAERSRVEGLPRLPILLPHLGSRLWIARDRLAGTYVTPCRLFPAAQNPRRLPGRAVGSVLTRGRYLHRDVYQRGCNVCHRRIRRRAANHEHPARLNTHIDERVDRVGKSAEHSLDGRPREILRCQILPTDAVKRSASIGQIGGSFPIEVREHDESAGTGFGGERQRGEGIHIDAEEFSGAGEDARGVQRAH